MDAVVGWIVSPQIHVYPEPQNVILFAIRVFVDIIRLRIKMKSCWVRVGPKSNANVPIGDRRGETQGEGNVKTGAEIAVMLPQAKECQELPATPEVRREA